MTKPILTATEYDALCNILEWAWNCVHSEPELCLKDVDYSSDSFQVAPATNLQIQVKIYNQNNYTINTIFLVHLMPMQA